MMKLAFSGSLRRRRVLKKGHEDLGNETCLLLIVNPVDYIRKVIGD